MRNYWTDDGRYYDSYRGRTVAAGDPCDVCGSTDTRLKTVEDGRKPLCDDHWEMFGP